MELILGRKPRWPIEIDCNNVDLSGTDLTAELVDALATIHNQAFGKASKNIKKEQERYAKAYDKRYKTNPIKLRVGMRVQVKKLKTKRAKRHGLPDWKPFRSYRGYFESNGDPRYYYLHAIDHKRGTVVLRNHTGTVMKNRYPIPCCRKWGGK